MSAYIQEEVVQTFRFYIDNNNHIVFEDNKHNILFKDHNGMFSCNKISLKQTSKQGKLFASFWLHDQPIGKLKILKS